MHKVAARFRGTRGVFLQFGDSLTLSAPCQRWARDGLGQTAEERAFLRWAHVNENDARDGWYLAKTLRGEGELAKISYTAGIGCSARYMLTGRRGLEPLDELIARYNPQMAVYAVGVSDILRGTPLDEFIADVETGLGMLLTNGTVPILATVTPCRDYQEQVRDMNAALRQLAAKLRMPLLDLYGEMERRTPNVLLYLADDGYHLNIEAVQGPATEDNLRKGGYLARAYLTVRKGMLVKAEVLDPFEKRFSRGGVKAFTRDFIYAILRARMSAFDFPIGFFRTDHDPPRILLRIV